MKIMFNEIKILITDSIPTEDDVREALSYAKDNNSYVKIMYIYHNESYEWLINPARSFEELWENRNLI